MHDRIEKHPAADGIERINPFVTRASIFARLRSPTPGDWERAWAEFQTRYGPVIAGFAKRCGATATDIDDIIQDVMTAFFAVSGEFVYDPAKGRFRGWLKTCTVRSAVRRAGKNLRFQGVPLDQVPETDIAIEPVWNDVWEQQLVACALHELRQTAGDTVPFKLFEQYVLAGKAADVVARECETSVDNVHQAKSRMTKRLREIVERIRLADE